MGLFSSWSAVLEDCLSGGRPQGMQRLRLIGRQLVTRAWVVAGGDRAQHVRDHPPADGQQPHPGHR